MAAKLLKVMLAVAAGAVSAPLAAGVPVELTGNTGADDVLQKDILQTITYYGAAFGCPAPSKVRASVLNAAMVPTDASYAMHSLRAAYEEWDAVFCGKGYRFFVSYAPDPNGGSFLAVQYPYPAGAPSAIAR